MNVVFQLREKKSLGALKKVLDNVPLAGDFVGALKSANARTRLLGLIAEVKKASPSRGIIRDDFDPVSLFAFWILFFICLPLFFIGLHYTQ